jgi:DNA-binding NarL/FixJ family response regulator
LLVADGQRLMRESLRILLESTGRFQVVAESETGRHAVEFARSKRPDAVVIDAQLPLLSGVDSVARIRRENPRCQCIITSSAPTPSLVRAALLAGASGFVPKSAGARELLDAIQTVLSGGSYLSQSAADAVAGAVRSPTDSGGRGVSMLTGRQREVLQLIAEGLSTRQIASELGISIKTAQAHRMRLMEKVGVHKVSSLVRFAIREGVIHA